METLTDVHSKEKGGYFCVNKEAQKAVIFDFVFLHLYNS